MRKPKIDLSDDFFGAVLNCAVRYSLGRQSYMPGLVIDFITPLLPYLSDKTLWCFEKDVREYIAPTVEPPVCPVRQQVKLTAKRAKTQNKEDFIMIVTGMAHFESVCKKKLVEWYHKNKPDVEIDLSNVFVVWACKTLQNYKCLVSTTISGDGIYAEYTYNGDKQELYEDVYGKITNTRITDE